MSESEVETFRRGLTLVFFLCTPNTGLTRSLTRSPPSQGVVGLAHAAPRRDAPPWFLPRLLYLEDLCTIINSNSKTGLENHESANKFDEQAHRGPRLTDKSIPNANVIPTSLG